ncbi:hypothetical protein [Actinomadura rupiterrae]|uniref:hypothetical protein n=1 Tax=Actinomadura rupiterrae TaxID=559627 RepID=UPI0020A38835|nr:hypothetical protein [Actinomadura rupiterrae]MCP2339056.1 hypothetical protein [Actinomadura rupiterrae]
MDGPGLARPDGRRSDLDRPGPDAPDADGLDLSHSDLGGLDGLDVGGSDGRGFDLDGLASGRSSVSWPQLDPGCSGSGSGSLGHADGPPSGAFEFDAVFRDVDVDLDAAFAALHRDIAGATLAPAASEIVHRARRRTRIRAASVTVALAVALTMSLGTWATADLAHPPDHPTSVAPGVRPLTAADLSPQQGAADLQRDWAMSAQPQPSVPGCGGAGPDFRDTVQHLTMTYKHRHLGPDGRGEIRQSQYFVFPTARAARQAMAVLATRAQACGPELRLSRPKSGEEALSLSLLQHPTDGPVEYRAAVVRQGPAVLVFSDYRKAVTTLDLALVDEPARAAATHISTLGYRS